MARKREDGILVLLTMLPWWASDVVAIVVYAVLRWMFPGLAGQSVFVKSIALRNSLKKTEINPKKTRQRQCCEENGRGRKCTFTPTESRQNQLGGHTMMQARSEILPPKLLVAHACSSFERVRIYGIDIYHIERMPWP
jgi:hypothetical protein